MVSISFYEPVCAVSFYYATAEDVILEVFDFDDNLIATATCFLNADGAVGLRNWDPINIDMNQNIISRIVFHGTSTPTFIDDLKVCSLFPEVSIDIKPGSFPNSINLCAKGNVPVAIFSTAEFDATTIDPLTLTLAGASVRLKGKNKSPQISFTDANGDGLLDLVVHIVKDELELDIDSTEAILEGITYDGERFFGRDSVNIVPHKK
jgi:hypothetical protein